MDLNKNILIILLIIISVILIFQFNKVFIKNKNMEHMISDIGYNHMVNPNGFYLKQNRNVIPISNTEECNLDINKVDIEVKCPFCHKINCTCKNDFCPICKKMKCECNLYPNQNQYQLQKWAVPMKSGIGNKSICSNGSGSCGDVLWHYMSPRMILMDNCMRCNEFKNSNVHVSPLGITSDLTNKHTGDINDIYNMTYNELLLPKGPHYMSLPMTNGIMPMYKDCVNKKVQSNNCGCEGIGEKVPNFHK